MAGESIDNKFDFSEPDADMAAERAQAKKEKAPQKAAAFESENEDLDYDSFEIVSGTIEDKKPAKDAAGDAKVIIDKEYTLSLPPHGDKVVVDRDYQLTVDSRADKVMVDQKFQQEVDEYEDLPELSSDLLEVIDDEDTPDEKADKRDAVAYDAQVEKILVESDKSISSLENKRQELLGKAVANAEQERALEAEVREVNVEIARAEKKRSADIERARVRFEKNIMRRSDTFELDPEALKQALEDFESQQGNINTEFNKKMDAAYKEWADMYEKFRAAGFPKVYPERSRLVELRHEMDVKLPRERDAKFAKARGDYEKAITPTALDLELFDLTITFEKQALKLENKISAITDVLERVKDFPVLAATYREGLKGLKEEAKNLARAYSRDVDTVKKEHEAIKNSRKVAEPASMPAKKASPPQQNAANAGLRKAA